MGGAADRQSARHQIVPAVAQAQEATPQEPTPHISPAVGVHYGSPLRASLAGGLLVDMSKHRNDGAIVALEDFSFDAEEHPLLGAPTLNVGTVNGGININSVADYAPAGIDVRTVPGMDGDGVLAALRTRLGDEVGLERAETAHPLLLATLARGDVQVGQVQHPQRRRAGRQHRHLEGHSVVRCVAD